MSDGADTRREFLGKAGTVVGIALVPGLAGCGPPPPGGNGDDPPSGQSTVDSLRVAGEANETLEAADTTVTGDVIIDGTLRSSGPKMVLRVNGDFTCNGTIATGEASTASRAEGSDATVPLKDMTTGLYLIVSGRITFGENAIVDVGGPLVITDDATQLSKSPAQIEEELADGGDEPATTAVAPRDGPDTKDVILSGEVRPKDGASSDRDVRYIYINDDADVIIRNWTVHMPAGKDGAPDDKSATPGVEAKGGDGGRGPLFALSNFGGAVRTDRDWDLHLAPGGEGGAAKARDAKAEGGRGGPAGGFSLVARDGIDPDPDGAINVYTGIGGRGGKASASGSKGPVGAPGGDGISVTAQGGIGGESVLAVELRNVVGAHAIIVGGAGGGPGGDAEATGGDGGDGASCSLGGPGGKATAVGGMGGRASASLAGADVDFLGRSGGKGGDAIARGGTGGLGGPCGTGAGGNGGPGGPAVAHGGQGGPSEGVNTLGLTRGGNGGNATTYGGNGGPCGNGTAAGAKGGGPGSRETVPGPPGVGPTPGTQGGTFGEDGKPGACDQDGSGDPLSTLRASFSFLSGLFPIDDAVVPSGTYTAPVFDEAGATQIGTVPIRLSEGTRFTQQVTQATDGVHYLGFSEGTLTFVVASMALNDGSGPTVVGLGIVPHRQERTAGAAPMIVRAKDLAASQLGQDVTFGDEWVRQEGWPLTAVSWPFPNVLDARFETGGSEIASIEIILPKDRWVAIFGVFILAL